MDRARSKNPPPAHRRSRIDSRRGRRGEPALDSSRKAPSSLLKRLSRFGGPLAIAFVTVTMLLRTWLLWTDPLIDYGHTLYVAWQLNEGKLLYRDLAYMYGPFTAYANALVFRLCGTHLLSMVFANLAVFSILLALCYRMVAILSDRLVATIACLLLVLGFGFNQLTQTANFNYMTPYSHEMTHGLTLGMASLAFLMAWLNKPSVTRAAGAGLCCGMTFLIKPEMFIASFAAVAGGLAAASWLSSSHRRTMWRWGPGFVLAMLGPSIIAYALFSSEMSPAEARNAVLGAWIPMTKSAMTGLAFYRSGMGTDDIAGNLGLLAKWSVIAGVGIGIGIWLSSMIGSAFGRRRDQVWFIAGLLGALMFIAGWVWWPPPVALHQVTRVLPLGVAVAGWLALRRGVRHRGDPQVLSHSLFVVGLCIFAVTMLLKMILNARIHHYGFVLALPATLVVIVSLLGWIPGWINSRGGAGVVFGIGACGLLAGFALSLLQVTEMVHARKTYAVDNAKDSFIADERGWLVNQALLMLDGELKPAETIAVIPEGVMINYLARRVNPTGYTSLLPSDVAVRGEQKIIEAFQMNPPDFILLVHRDMLEFKTGAFGWGYARDLAAWLKENYSVHHLLGNEDIDNRLGMVLMKRNEQTTQPAGDVRPAR